MKKFYVYAYLREDRQTPYYIGKGCRDRINNPSGRNTFLPPADRRVKIKEKLTEEEALTLEALLINQWGRKIEGGVLHNLQEGGKQPPSRKGCPQPNTEQLRKINKGNTYWKKSSAFRGKKHKPESFQKQCKKVRIGDKTYNSGWEASRVLGVGRSTINLWIAKGKASWV